MKHQTTKTGLFEAAYQLPGTGAASEKPIDIVATASHETGKLSARTSHVRA